MDTSTIISYFKGMPIRGQNNLLSTLTAIKSNSDLGLIDLRETKFNEKQGVCPHCENIKYVKMGKDNGVQRYKCKSCNRTFTPYTGTWMSQIHKKNKLADYLKLMQQGLSLDKIKVKLGINKKTAFDWRHKITQSIRDSGKDIFIGITESDETFFLHSEKGSGKLTRKPRKRGKQVKTSGISKEQVAVIAVADRKGTVSLEVSCFGRLSKKDIEKAIGERTNERTILCTDGHASFKGFALDNNIEHHVLKANLKQFVKQGKFHIQNINSLHSRLKSWINIDLYGVSTKYLQNYLNWFRLKEKFKKENYLKKIVLISLSNTNARAEYLYAVKNIYNGKTTPY
jgi:transposase-like protein